MGATYTKAYPPYPSNVYRVSAESRYDSLWRTWAMLVACVLLMAVHGLWTSKRVRDRVFWEVVVLLCVAEGLARVWR